MKRNIFILFTILFQIAVFTGCGEIKEDVTGALNEPVYEASRPGEYDSQDTAIVTRIGEVSNSITLYNPELEKSYTLKYDSVTKYADKHGTAISVSQIKKGSIVDVLFLKSDKKLVSLKENAEAFTIADVTGFSIDTKTKVFNVLDETLKITEATILLSGENELTLNDLREVDTITIRGMDNLIYSVTVEKGHGTISLKGEEKLLKGTLEIGTKQIETITSGKEIMVPEGDYEVKIKKGKTEAEKKITVKAGQNTVLDLSDIEIVEDRIGRVLFESTPEDITLYIDGKQVDAKKLQELGYGLHKLEASAKGYESVIRYFKVGEEQATLPITLEKTEEESADGEVDSSKTDGYFVFIWAPVGAELSYDGIYIGKTPLSVKKTAGTHTISLRKNGCVSRSYTILIENEENDVSYTFDELEEKSSSNEEKSVSSNEPEE